MDFELTITTQSAVIDVTALCEGNITLTTERRGSPGKLTFTLLRHKELAVEEGNAVSLTVQGTPMFHGYLFRDARSKDPLISMTAYDQLRYLKNKDTYVYENKTAADVLRRIAGDFGCVTGVITDTGYVIPARSEDSQTLMDIIYNALDLTVIHTGQLFVLYDDCGKLTIKNIHDLRLDAVVSTRGAMLDYSYIRDIDTDTYNKIKLYQDNKDTGRREVYTEMDSDNIASLGVLQLYEKVDDNLNEAQIVQRAQQLLKNHNRVKQTLNIDHLAGDLKVRGGSSLYVELADQDVEIVKLLVVKKCVHTFSHEEHTMRLELEGLD